MKLSRTPKKWLLTGHILFGAIMFGNIVTFLILSISAATAKNEELVETCYQVMNLLANTSVKASTFGTIITGILLSIWTKWGLFNFYWIIAKEVLTFILFGINVWGMYAWTNEALMLIRNSKMSTDIFLFQVDLWIGITIQLISLIFIFVLSVFKPWGRRSSKSV